MTSRALSLPELWVAMVFQGCVLLGLFLALPEAFLALWGMGNWFGAGVLWLVENPKLESL